MTRRMWIQIYPWLDALDEGGPQQECDVEDVDEDEEDFVWKCHLLEYIEQYPLLYDKTHPDFKNKYSRAAVWQEISTGLDSEGAISNLYSVKKSDKLCVNPLCNDIVYVLCISRSTFQLCSNSTLYLTGLVAF